MRIKNAIKHSIQGYKSAYKTEPALKTEMIGGIILLPIAILIAKNNLELSLLLGSGILVVVVELLNTSIERAIDRIGPETHPLSKDSKDIASAAVMTSIILMVVVWVLIIIK